MAPLRVPRIIFGDRYWWLRIIVAIVLDALADVLPANINIRDGAAAVHRISAIAIKKNCRVKANSLARLKRELAHSLDFVLTAELGMGWAMSGPGFPRGWLGGVRRQTVGARALTVSILSPNSQKLWRQANAKLHEAGSHTV